MDIRLARMARVLVEYCLDIKKGDMVFVEAEVSSLPLVRAFHLEAVRHGATVEPLLMDQTLKEQMLRHGSEEQLSREPFLLKKSAEYADAILTIWGNSNTRALSNIDPARMQTHVRAQSKIIRLVTERIATHDMRWCGTQFPTEAGAQEASMSLPEYEDFVFGALMLDAQDPVAEWRRVEREQSRLCRILDGKKELRISSKDTELTMSIAGRRWANCCGKENFPDGEIFTSPVEDSINGHVRFSFPGIEYGREIEDIRLIFRDGLVVGADATKGKDLLLKLLDTDEGSRRLGEIGIGTNYGIDRFTKNMLFDEKIGGTIHLAIGEGFPEAFGRNVSAIHWDMLCDMRKGGQIFADGELIYKDGRFIV